MSAKAMFTVKQSSSKISILAIILMMLLAFSPSSEAEDTRAIGARTGGDAKQTRFVLDVTGIVQFTPEILQNPAQLRLKFPSVHFDLPPGAGQKTTGLVARLRYGQAADGSAEVLLDLVSPAKIANSYFIPKKGGKPARIVVDLEAVPGVAAPDPAAPVSAEPRPARKFHVVIDPGHGGMDPGTVSAAKTTEKSVVLAFSLELKRQLDASGLFEVSLTREIDRFISLPERVAIARARAADLFIAIHADSVRTKATRGLTLYTLSEKASDAEAAALALKENRADIIAGVDLGHEDVAVADVLIDLAQRESKAFAQAFATQAIKELKPVALMTGVPVRSAGFVVLKAPDVPSVLLELGYLSNKEDEQLLLSAGWQHTIAAAMVQAITAHFAAMAPAETGSVE